MTADTPRDGPRAEAVKPFVTGPKTIMRASTDVAEIVMGGTP
ncbi:hypothetical protein [Mobilicoccus caccae]|nr:hypothetical protein [Mobilicoccus caccae]